MSGQISVLAEDLHVLLKASTETEQYRVARRNLQEALHRHLNPIKRGDWVVYEPVHPLVGADPVWEARRGRRVLVTKVTMSSVYVSDDQNPLYWWSAGHESFRHEDGS